ncbi:MAG: 30S ribosomal protein S2 [Solirubrobacterales bacterium]|nr:30S ribosomal protein S2 [Solirubrobacterales bacterium]
MGRQVEHAVCQPALPGLLTNFSVSSQRIKRMHEIRGLVESGQIELLPTKERMNMQAELAKLEFALGGVADMDRVPDAVFITDLKSEEIALNEASRLRLPVIALVDTNCDPGHIDHVVPGNDDAIRSCELVISTIGSAVEQGAGAWAVIEEKRRAEEQARREKEEAERKKREEEERARREQIEKEQAEEKARKREEQQKAEAAAKEQAAKPHPQAVPDNPHPQAVPDNPHPQAVPDNPHPQAIQEDAPHPQAVPDNPHPQAVAPDPEPAEEPAQTEETPAEEPAADENTEEKG